MQNNETKEAHIHYVVAFMGGFLGLFPILNIAHLFGSSQTSNMIELVLSIFGREWSSVFFHFLGTFLYSFAIFLATFLPKYTKINIKILAMIIDILAGIVMCILPKDIPAIFTLYPTFFAMAFQWSSFSGGYGFACSTIFSTNNLKQFISSFTEVVFNKNKNFILKMKFFGATLLSYHFGVSFSFICWKFFDNKGFLFIVIPATVVLLKLKKNFK